MMHPGYSEQEYDGKIASIGVPILQDGRGFAALNILFLKSALSTKDAVQTLLLPPLTQTAGRIATELAGRLGQ